MLTHTLVHRRYVDVSFIPDPGRNRRNTSHFCQTSGRVHTEQKISIRAHESCMYLCFIHKLPKQSSAATTTLASAKTMSNYHGRRYIEKKKKEREFYLQMCCVFIHCASHTHTAYVVLDFKVCRKVSHKNISFMHYTSLRHLTTRILFYFLLYFHFFSTLFILIFFHSIWYQSHSMAHKHRPTKMYSHSRRCDVDVVLPDLQAEVEPFEWENV